MRTLRKASFDLTAEVTKEIDRDEKDHPPHSRGNSGDKTEESLDGGKAEPQCRGD